MKTLLSLLACCGWLAAAAPAPQVWFVDALTKIFPDDGPGTARPEAPVFETARRANLSVQLAVRCAAPLDGVSVQAAPLRGPGGRLGPVEVRWVEYVQVDSNSRDTPGEELVRKAPGLFPDPLHTGFPIALEKERTRAIWLTLAVPEGQKPGDYRGEVRLLRAGRTAARARYTVKVYPATVPKPIPLAITNYLNLSDGLFQRHFGVARRSPEGWDVIGNIARFLASYHQNGIFQNTARLVAARLDGSALRYDFTEFDRFFGTFLSAGVDANIQGGNLMERERRKDAPIHVDAWVVQDGKPVLQRIPLADPRARQFLDSYLPALYEHLKSKGWDRKYLQGVMDEPAQGETEAFAEVAAMVRRHMPGIRIIEPMSLRLDPDFLSKNIDIWVMHLGTLANRLDVVEKQAAAGRELWYYTSLTPRGKYPNRLIDYSLLKVRILHWINFRYGLTGFLHWGANYWPAEPYRNTQPVINQGRTLLPPGDAFITYPNRAGRTFFSSIRLEQMREGIEDYGLLCELSKKDPERARRIVGDAVQSFTEYTRDPVRFREIRRQLLAAF